MWLAIGAAGALPPREPRPLGARHCCVGAAYVISTSIKLAVGRRGLWSRTCRT